MALDGFIFDVDGVLIDSNDAHVEAWEHAFRQQGYAVERDRLFVEMGKGGDKLVPQVLGQQAEERHGNQLRQSQKNGFRDIALARGLSPTPGARELIAAMKERGLRVALATSSSDEQLEVAEKASQVPWRRLVHEVVTARDVTETKPAPDLVAVAVARLGMGPAQCAMIGDTPWDARAATKAGVTLVGVTCGGNDEAVLKRGGARIVEQDPAALVARLDDVLRDLSPAALHLDGDALGQLMGAALEMGEAALADGHAPVGAVLADSAGKVIASAHGRGSATRNPAMHAAIEVFRRAADRSPGLPRPLLLATTVEPCVMCFGAAWEARIDTVIYGLRTPRTGGPDRISPHEQAHGLPRVVGGVQEERARRLFQRWQTLPDRNRAQERFVTEVLSDADGAAARRLV